MEIMINDKAVSAPNKLRDVALIDFIRDFADLKGTKFGCGIGLCGACTVHVNGVANRSCQLRVGDVVGKEVTTIEGLTGTTSNGGLHPVQQAWIDEAVPQCGYCQVGQIMTAVALLNDNPNPTEDEIKNGMSGNLCRCGTYTRIQRAVARVANGGQNVGHS